MTKARFSAVVIAALLGFACTLGPARAQSVDGAELARVVAQGDFARASAMLEDGAATDADRLFLDGLVLKSRGAFGEAAARFRAILDSDPGYINARRELGHTLLLNGEDREARKVFRSLRRLDPNPQMQRVYLQFLSQLEARKRAGLRFHLALRPSSNVNRGTHNSSFSSTLGDLTLGDDSQAKSAMGLELGLSGHFAQRLSGRSRAVLNWSVTQERYDLSQHDRDRAAASLSLQFATQLGHLSISPFAQTTWASAEPDETTQGVQIALNRAMAQNRAIALSLSRAHRDVAGEEARDGPVERFSFRLTQKLRPDLTAHVGFAARREMPQVEHMRFGEQSIFGGVRRSWENGLDADLGLEIGKRAYEADFPLTTSPRSDSFSVLSLGFANAGWSIFGYAPAVRCSYTRQLSNVSLSDYHATDCRAELTLDF